MRRATNLKLAMLLTMAILPAAAQETGGLLLQGGTSRTLALLEQIQANRGCPLSATSVTVGINKAFATGSSANQQLSTTNRASGPTGCRPLVSTQVVAGANLALGSASQAGQSIDVQGQRGALATNTFTRGINVGAGAASSATQHIQNLVSR